MKTAMPLHQWRSQKFQLGGLVSLPSIHSPFVSPLPAPLLPLFSLSRSSSLLLPVFPLEVGPAEIQVGDLGER